VPFEVAPLDPEDLDEARELLAESCEFDQAAEVAEEKLFGAGTGGAVAMPIAARAPDGSLLGVAVASDSWLRLIAVSPTARGEGIGSELLATAEDLCWSVGADEIRTLDQPGNYLAPGIDVRNQHTINWLLERGFEHAGENVSLLIDLRDNPHLARLPELEDGLTDAGYLVRPAVATDAPALQSWITEMFSAGWAAEAERAAVAPPGGVHIAIDEDDGALVGFAAHDGNNRGLGWFGPAGTDPEHRGHGIGATLLLRCLRDIRNTGLDRCLISWVGPREFYDRAAGVTGERRYAVLRKYLASERTIV